MAKGWLDNYGKEDNYNDYQVSAPKGFRGDGYSNVGRNYSPAWGGQFQMGGNVYPVNYVPEAQMGMSLPGATGRMYARTNHPAPSNGKYAKKTKASAQDGKTVKYGTPEYEKAYNKGEVITEEGVRSPILLDEVVVKGKKKNKNWLEQYADKIVEENKDASVLGAILGTPISAVTSLPQLMGMKAFAGEMERPSEALDIENPYGAFAVDAVADPANLIGVGELSGLSKLAKEKALSKLVASKESGLLSRAHEINPLAFKPKSEAYYRQVFGEEAAKSPIITRTMRANNDPKGISSFVNSTERKFYKGDTDEVFSDLALPNTSIDSNDALPYFNRSKPYYSNNVFKGKPKETLIETNFSAKDYEDFYPGSMDVVSVDPLNDGVKRFGNVRVLNPFSKEGHDLKNYNFYEKDWLQGYKKVSKPASSFESGAIELGALQQKRDGGVIKDDMGQWAHPGEITEINSNNITMEGVPYDVLGISDIGDTKLMKPGKNYKFKGKKVTEYPMAKNGLRQEQKGLQNLDQLTNFTNYNTKQPGGWLDTL